jgi:protein gp37
MATGPSSMMNGPDNGIGWCDYTWNPITGCKHGCRFGPNDTPCYAEVIAERFRGTKGYPNGFEPTFRPERLSDPRRLKTPARIFTCSMADLFGSWVPRAWILAVLEAMAAAPWHTFLLLTKAPWIAVDYDVPSNVWLGATVTGGLQKEAYRLACVRRYRSRVRFLSCEPLEGPLDVSAAAPDWIIIGAATGRGAFQPDDAWVAGIERYAARVHVPIYHKDNLTIRRPRRLEWPEQTAADATHQRRRAGQRRIALQPTA